MCRTMKVNREPVVVHQRITITGFQRMLLASLFFAAAVPNASAEVIAEGFDLNENREHGGPPPVNYRVLCKQTDSDLPE